MKGTWRRAALLAALLLLGACRGEERDATYYAPPRFGADADEGAAAEPRRTATEDVRAAPERTNAADAGPESPPSSASEGVAAAALPMGRLPDYVSLYRRLSPTVVNLYTTQGRHLAGRDPWGLMPAQSLGSGVIVSAEGWVLTNHHVVENAASIRARLSDGRSLQAVVVGTDPPTDLALLRLEEAGDALPVAELGDSDVVQVGDWVAAIGNPFGLEGTLTRGIVSAKGRRPQEAADRGYVDFLQTDAAINPGNSGGPLFDMDGRVIGINSAIASQGRGIAFAIPSNMAREVMTRLGTAGSVARGWLGVVLESDEDAGVVRVVRVIPGSPAAKAGIATGDVLKTLDGKTVESPFDLRWRVAMAGVGSTVTLELERSGEQRLVSVVLAALGVVR